jgi:hypothetical protein
MLQPWAEISQRLRRIETNALGVIETNAFGVIETEVVHGKG